MASMWPSGCGLLSGFASDVGFGMAVSKNHRGSRMLGPSRAQLRSVMGSRRRHIPTQLDGLVSGGMAKLVGFVD